MPALFLAAVGVVQSLFIYGPQALADNWKLNKQICDTGPWTHCAEELGWGYFYSTANAVSRSLDKLDGIPIHQSILLLATWSLFAFLISQGGQVDDAGAGPSNIKAWLRSAYTNRKSSTFANVAFFLILAIGAYLSTAAIAAIPGLQEKSTTFQEVSTDKLKAQLEESFSAFDKYPSDIAAASPFAKLRVFVANVRKPASASQTGASSETQQSASSTEAASSDSPVPSPSPVNQPTPLPAGAAPNTTPTPAATAENQNKPPRIPTEQDLLLVESLVNSLEGERSRLIQTYKNLLEGIKSDQKSAKTQAVQAYDVGNLDRKGNKERVQYFLQITEWFNRRAAVSEKELGACVRSIQTLDYVSQQWADSIPGRLQSDYYSLGLAGNDFAFAEAFKACPISISFSEPLPERPQLGQSSYLGPFGYVASWLLRTESLPLALITGLLGFGLLGSAFSTFVRERAIARKTVTGEQPTTANAPAVKLDPDRIVTDLTGAVIRGLSAAVVVFLAVEGGLAMFASGGSEPNPYVLLLTCLIGAVFSERVWKWAEEQITKKVGTAEVKEVNPDGQSEDEDDSQKDLTSESQVDSKDTAPEEEPEVTTQTENEPEYKSEEDQVEEG